MKSTTNDSTDGLVEAIEELISDFGPRAVIAATQRTALAENLEKMEGASRATLRLIQKLVLRIVYSAHPALEAECLAVASGIILREGETMTSVARRFGVGKAAISKRAITLTDTLGLPPSTFMRALKDREAYRLSNRPRSPSGAATQRLKRKNRAKKR
jgi:hypothetical protein